MSLGQLLIRWLSFIESRESIVQQFGHIIFVRLAYWYFIQKQYKVTHMYIFDNRASLGTTPPPRRRKYSCWMLNWIAYGSATGMATRHLFSFCPACHAPLLGCMDQPQVVPFTDISQYKQVLKGFFAYTKSYFEKINIEPRPFLCVCVVPRKWFLGNYWSHHQSNLAQQLPQTWYASTW